MCKIKKIKAMCKNFLKSGCDSLPCYEILLTLIIVTLVQGSHCV